MFKKNKKLKQKVDVKAPWYKIYGDVIPRNLDYPDLSVYDFFYNNAKDFNDINCYDYFGKSCSYKNFIRQIEEAAKSFKSFGIKKGDVVTICMPNAPEAIVSFYALNKIGAIANMIHPLSAEEEIKYYLNISDSVMLISIDLAFSKIVNIIDDTKIERVVFVSAKDSMPKAMQVGYDLTKGRKVKKFKKSDRVISFSDFIKAGKNYIGSTSEKVNGSDVCAILYSGGTTGNPKGILLSNNNFNAVAMQNYVMCGGIGPGDAIVAVMPIFHGFGLGVCVHSVLSYGGKSILVPQFNIKEFYKILKRQRPTIIIGVPTLYEALITDKKISKLKLDHVRIAISGGDSLSSALSKRINNFLISHHSPAIVREGYGMTESVCASCLNPAYDVRDGSIGIPYPDTFYKIVAPGTHTELPYGEDGEICISGPTVMMGYLKNKAETDDTLQLHEDGRIWLHTGDAGCMSEDGYVYFKLRLKRMIVSSGYNIYPQYIEDIVEKHPAVFRCTVIGIPHPYKMQVAKAYIVLKDDIKLTDDLKTEIYEYCKRNIAKYSMPAVIEYRDELPKTLVGKVAYKKLMEESEYLLDKEKNS